MKLSVNVRREESEEEVITSLLRIICLYHSQTYIRNSLNTFDLAGISQNYVMSAFFTYKHTSELQLSRGHTPECRLY